jgi:hypothetical protein
MIQDETRYKPKSIHLKALEITSIVTIYQWFDWFIYMNMLLAQIDMVLVEIVADLFMSIGTTVYYIKTSPPDIRQEEALMLVTDAV